MDQKKLIYDSSNNVWHCIISRRLASHGRSVFALIISYPAFKCLVFYYCSGSLFWLRRFLILKGERMLFYKIAHSRKSRLQYSTSIALMIWIIWTIINMPLLSSNDRLSNISQGKFHRTITKTLVTFPQFRLIMPMGWPCDLTAIVFGCLEYFLFHGIC